MKRMAIMRVSNTVWDEIVADPYVASRSDGMKIVHGRLRLPDNCRVDAISPHHFLAFNAVAVRLESPDFQEVPECFTIPETEAMYCMTEDLLGKKVGHFAGWSGGTQPEYAPPPKPDTSRCSEELGHFQDPDKEARNCFCGRVQYVNGTWMLDPKVGPNGGVVATWQPEPQPVPPRVGYVDGMDWAAWDSLSDEMKITVWKAARPSGKNECCCEGGRRVERVPGDAATLLGFWCPTHGRTEFKQKEPVEEPQRSNRGYEFL